jgi:hypothetical protein
MISGHNRSKVAVLVVLSVLTIFLFHALEGPYSAVNGPVTALQGARSAARLRVILLHDAVESVGIRPIWLLVVASWAPLSEANFQLISSSEFRTILRC